MSSIEAPSSFQVATVSTAEQLYPIPFTQFSTRYDPDMGAIWCFMWPKPRPCINSVFLDEFMHLQRQLQIIYKKQNTIRPFNYLILESNEPGIFNLGGDLHLFKHLIQNKDKKRLSAYAHKSVELLYNNTISLDLPITMIALVQGQALGGGFEAALSCDFIIAERSAKMGFPEVLFNLFPGMGAYNLLTRRLNSVRAEKMILSGRIYTAEELYDMGIVDILANDGEGQQVTEQYLKDHSRKQNTYHAIQKMRRITNPISYGSLVDIVNMWVEAALRLNRKDIFKMERLLYAQNLLSKNKSLTNEVIMRPRSHNDWRKIKGSSIEFPLLNHLGELILNERRQLTKRRAG